MARAWCDLKHSLCHIVTVCSVCTMPAGCSQAIPLVPLTEENEEAMENEQFQHLLRKLGIRPPSSGQASIRASVTVSARGLWSYSEHACCYPDPPCCLSFASQDSHIRSLARVSLLSRLPFPKPCSMLPSSPRYPLSVWSTDGSVCCSLQEARLSLHGCPLTPASHHSHPGRLSTLHTVGLHNQLIFPILLEGCSHTSKVHTH